MALARHMLHSTNQNSNKKIPTGRVLLMTMPNQTIRNSQNLARSPPKILTYHLSTSFGDFKRICGEKVSIVCTRVFTLTGGEVDAVSQLEKDDVLICTSGEVFVAPTVKTFEAQQKQAQQNHKVQFLRQRSHSPPPGSPLTSTVGGNLAGGLKTTPTSALSRFKSAVRRVQGREKRGKHMGTKLPIIQPQQQHPQPKKSSTTIVPISVTTNSSINGNNIPPDGDALLNIARKEHTENTENDGINSSTGSKEFISDFSADFSTAQKEVGNMEELPVIESVEGRRRSAVWDSDEISMTKFKEKRDSEKRELLSKENNFFIQKMKICWNCIRSKFMVIKGGTSVDDPVREVFALPIIMPEHPYRIWWDGGLTLLVIYYSLAVPLRLAFTLAFPSEGETYFDIACSFLFIIDIVVNFCTAIKVRGVYLTDHSLIASYYLKSWFIIDFVSSMPIDLLFLGNDQGAGSGSATNSLKMLKSLRIFKLLRVLRLQRIINRLETHHHVDPSALRMGKLVGILVTTWHWLGCFYWGVAELEYSDINQLHDEWMPPSHIWQATSLGPQYAFAFFWAVVVTSGIGWDIIPNTSLQITFTTFAIVTGLLIYAIIIGSASTLLANLDSVESERKAKMNEVKSLLRNRHVPKALSSEIYEFFEYLLSCNNSNIDEYSILSELPQSLRSRLNIAINRQIIKSIPIFCDCSDHAMALLIEQLYQLVILPGEYVMEQGMPGNEMYFVVRGKLQVIRDSKEGHRVTMAKRGEGDFFGEIALFEDYEEHKNLRWASVKALTYCDLLTLPREGFDFIKLHFPAIIDTMKTAAVRRKETIATVNKIVLHGDGGNFSKNNINSAFTSQTSDASFRPQLLPTRLSGK